MFELYCYTLLFFVSFFVMIFFNLSLHAPFPLFPAIVPCVFGSGRMGKISLVCLELSHIFPTFFHSTCDAFFFFFLVSFSSKTRSSLQYTKGRMALHKISIARSSMSASENEDLVL